MPAGGHADPTSQQAATACRAPPSRPAPRTARRQPTRTHSPHGKSTSRRAHRPPGPHVMHRRAAEDPHATDRRAGEPRVTPSGRATPTPPPNRVATARRSLPHNEITVSTISRLNPKTGQDLDTQAQRAAGTGQTAMITGTAVGEQQPTPTPILISPDRDAAAGCPHTTNRSGRCGTPACARHWSHRAGRHRTRPSSAASAAARRAVAAGNPGRQARVTRSPHHHPPALTCPNTSESCRLPPPVATWKGSRPAKETP